MQKTYRRSLIVLAVMVAMVLLIACANVANLMTAQAAARQREMALRISIGAGRGRLMQMVLVESALVALLATAIGAMFAWWAAPFVVARINPPHNPARLLLPADWRVLAFTVLLALGVTVLFGMAPALRASSVRPVSALKGGEDPHSRRRLMNALVAAQVAFCFLVHFVAGLFVSTFDRLSNQPMGFSADRLLVLDVVAKSPQPPVYWDQVTGHVRSLAGVKSAGLSLWALMSGSGSEHPVWANGHSPDGSGDPHFMYVSPGWLEAMKIPLLDGRDFRPEESFPNVAIVNQAFARRYFDGQNPVGRSFETLGRRVRVDIIGYVADARYDNMRDPIRATAYAPFRRGLPGGPIQPVAGAAFVVRTSGANPLQMAPMLRRAVPEARSEFRVSNIRTQDELIRMHTIRERLLAMLSMFFAVVALLLAAVGLYGVLDYSVLMRRREIGIRLALGAQSAEIVRSVTAEASLMLVLGSGMGLGLGITSQRYIETLLYQVKATDSTMLALPLVTILSVSLLASLPAVLRAVRINPSAMLRAD